VTGGKVSMMSGWFDAGTQLQSIASANPGWQFENWSGSGGGSYSGNSDTMLAAVNAPLTETATFYPGMTINASGNVSVSYSFGVVTGVVHSGTSRIIYAPTGTDIHLIAKPKLLIYSFSGWTGSTISNKSKLSVVMNAPQNMITGSAYNYINIVITSAVVIAVIVAAIVIISRKRKKPLATDREPETKNES
jgi:hypothetical protein